jgi:hypothetical protein
VKLTSKAIFNTGPFVVDGVQHSAVWTEPEGRTIHIRKSLVWIGLDLDAQADLYAQLMRTRDGAVINPFCWDRYANPSAPHQHMNDFHGDDYMELTATDSITLYYYAASGKACHAHAAAWIWYF